jgi:hypothetical protein
MPSRPPAPPDPLDRAQAALDRVRTLRQPDDEEESTARHEIVQAAAEAAAATAERMASRPDVETDPPPSETPRKALRNALFAFAVALVTAATSYLATHGFP